MSMKLPGAETAGYHAVNSIILKNPPSTPFGKGGEGEGTPNKDCGILKI